MPDPVFVPEWVDRRTAEWCAQLCDAVETRLLLTNRRQGARACATAIRMTLSTGKPALPASTLCSDCPPEGYVTDKTRCEACPRRETS